MCVLNIFLIHSACTIIANYRFREPLNNYCFREQPRSTVSIRGSGNYNHYDQGYRRGGRMYDQNRGPNNHNQRGGNRGGGGGSYNNNYGNMGAAPPRDMRDRERPRDDRMVRKRVRSPPDRPLPYVRLVSCCVYSLVWNVPLFTVCCYVCCYGC